MERYRNGNFTCSMEDYNRAKEWVDSHDGDWLENPAWIGKEIGISKWHIIVGLILKESSEWMKWTRHKNLWVRMR